jgi:hypothetical protein
MTPEEFEVWWHERALSLNITAPSVNSSVFIETRLDKMKSRKLRHGKSFLAKRAVSLDITAPAVDSSVHSEAQLDNNKSLEHGKSFVAMRELLLMDSPSWRLMFSHLRLALYLLLWGTFMPYSFLVIKWLLVYRMPKGAHSLFGSLVQRHFFVWMLSESWMKPFLTRWEGTLALNYFYRLLGVKIGSRTLLLHSWAGSYGDVDMWEIGDDCVIDGNVWQSHTFEDRVFWNWPSIIGDRCYVGPNVSLMGGASLEDDVNLGAASVPWKMQVLAGGKPGCPRSYHGNPPMEVAGAPCGIEAPVTGSSYDPYDYPLKTDLQVSRQGKGATLLETRSLGCLEAGTRDKKL